MEKVLNQEEIDAMVQAARGAAASGQPRRSRGPTVQPWDVRQAGQIGREQMHAISLLHETFARNLTHSLGAYLRVVFEATLVSAEHLVYREFLQRIPEVTYLASCRLSPIGVSAMLQLDLKVAFPIIDVLLGGQGKSLAATREITEIEEQILESVVQIICRELGTAWQALALEFCFDQRQDPTQARRLMPPDEKTLSLSFEITMPEVRGGLSVAVPAVVSNALLRKISADWTYQKPRGPAESQERLRRRLLACSFPAELVVPRVPAHFGDLVDLAPGKLLMFRRRAAMPATWLVGGLEMFQALPVRCGQVRSARLLPRLRENELGEDHKEKP